jgi:hypothetical protein
MQNHVGHYLIITSTSGTQCNANKKLPAEVWLYLFLLERTEVTAEALLPSDKSDCEHRVTFLTFSCGRTAPTPTPLS